MVYPLVSRRKAHTASTALFFIGMAILIVTEAWWPGIMLVVGLSLALRQYLLSRLYDMCISLLVFVGTFVTVQFDINWRVFLPILFTIGSLYILWREFFLSDTEQTEAEKEEDVQHEIEEKRK